MWVDRQREDHAIKVSRLVGIVYLASNAPFLSSKIFVPQLKRHLLSRILGSQNHPDFSDQEIGRIRFHQERMYRYNMLWINYTSYDVLRQQYVINPSNSRCFVLLPTEFDTDSNAHPFSYAKIIGIYHAKIIYGNQLAQRIDFVHVRWLYYDENQPGGWDTGRLDRVGYETCQTDQDILDSFDFVNPCDIIRAAHLIPDFKSGITTFLRGPSIAHDNEEHGDWFAYYVNQYVRNLLILIQREGAITDRPNKQIN